MSTNLLLNWRDISNASSPIVPKRRGVNQLYTFLGIASFSMVSGLEGYSEFGFSILVHSLDLE